MSRRFLKVFCAAAILVAAQISTRADVTNSGAVKAAVLENEVAYFRVSEVNTNFANEIGAAENTIPATNKIVGTVLDLRFANGDDSAAAQSAVDFFDAKKLPLAILVNGETQGAADKLALDLRAARAGLVFGGATADLKPDIAVTVAPADEKIFLKNPYAILATNNVTAKTHNALIPFIDHTSEADLVRAKIKDGDEDETTAPTRPAPPKPVVRDPTLARALDFLKALAILQPIKTARG